METIKEKLSNSLNFIISNVSCSLFQILVMINLSVAQFIIWLFSGYLILSVYDHGEISIYIPYAISYISIALIYGIAWFGFWSILYKGHIKWFYSRLLFSIIPLLGILMTFDPTIDPMEMIPTPREPIFSSIVTAIILLPIYSILTYKFVLQSNVNKTRNTIFICVITSLIGLLIFCGSWNMMSIIYSFFKFKPLFQL